jgi:4-hydroxy-3-polyprenylbenzoate decarboxylase
VGTFVTSMLYMGRFVILVDEDVDVTNLKQVLWAVGTRCDPATTLQVIKGTRSSALDPRVPPEKRAAGDWTMSMAVVDACRPFVWRKQFPVVNRVGEEVRQSVRQKWADQLESWKRG